MGTFDGLVGAVLLVNMHWGLVEALNTSYAVYLVDLNEKYIPSWVKNAQSIFLTRFREAASGPSQ